MYEEFFSRRLTQLRMQKGVSAREMSLAIGQNSSYINRIENRKALPSMQGFFYICEYLEVTPGEFFAEGEPVSLRLAGLAEELARLDPAQLEAIRTVVRGLQPGKPGP